MPNQTLELQRLLYPVLDPYPKQPIEPNGPFYVDLYEGADDPMRQIAKKMLLSGADSLQFLSGCRGSGKTTELHRLRCMLEKEGYEVFHVDALEFINPGLPIEISELMVVLAAAFDDECAKRFGDAYRRQEFVARLQSFLGSIRMEGAEASVSQPGGGLGFKVRFRTEDTLRKQIREKFRTRLAELHAQTERFIGDAMQWVQANVPRPGGERTGWVLLFDSLEQLRGSLTTEAAVMSSVEAIFTIHRERLRVPNLHVVHTVPPWLRYRVGGALPLELMIPCVKLWEKKPAEGRAHQRDAIGWSKMRDIVRRRVNASGSAQMARVFGPSDANGDHELLDLLVEFCGGHFRDLLYLTRECLVASSELPFTRPVVDHVLGRFQSQFQVTDDGAEWLAKIMETRSHCLPSVEPNAVASLTRYLDHHVILLFSNGTEWYDVHPIVQEDVRRIVQRLRAKAAAGPTAPDPKIVTG